MVPTAGLGPASSGLACTALFQLSYAGAVIVWEADRSLTRTTDLP
jgi:hypothetical protein